MDSSLSNLALPITILHQDGIGRVFSAFFGKFKKQKRTESESESEEENEKSFKFGRKKSLRKRKEKYSPDPSSSESERLSDSEDSSDLEDFPESSPEAKRGSRKRKVISSSEESI